jgi:hypothetical protein
MQHYHQRFNCIACRGVGQFGLQDRRKRGGINAAFVLLQQIGYCSRTYVRMRRLARRYREEQ